MSYHAANRQLVKKLDNKKKTIKMIQNQQPGEDIRKPITDIQNNWMISRRQKQHEEIRTLMNHVKVLEEETIKMVSVPSDDLSSSKSVYA